MGCCGAHGGWGVSEARECSCSDYSGHNPSITIAATGTLGLVWAGFEWFRSKSERIHNDTEMLLRRRLDEACKDADLALAAKRLLLTEWENREREWEKEKRNLNSEVSELTAQVAGLLERSGEHKGDR